jgi:DNA-directed RNA polymerase specialized sigma24 family protein
MRKIPLLIRSDCKHARRSPRNGTDLRLEIVRTLEKLSPQQKELCRLIGEEGLSINEACSHFGKHRSNIYRDVIRIKEVFEKEGLKDYLK